MTKLEPGILQTKQHFHILDGLRGVAALAVVTFHFMEIVYSDYSKNFIGHGFLAVDFFFCLSGFVIAYAYDNRIGIMGIKEFFKSRLTRLHPMVVLGSVIGLSGFLLDPFSNYAALYGAGKIALIFLLSAFTIPFPIMPERGFNLFSFNAPAWSLFWEYAANIVYAFILCKISRRWLMILLVPAGAALCFVSYRAGNLMGGWAGQNFWDGGARICYSFLAGMLVYRSNWVIKNRLGFPGVAALLLLPFIMPLIKINWLLEALAVLFYFPLIIALGAGATLTPRLRKVCVVAGQISYPLYMTHYTALWIFAGYYTTWHPGAAQLTVVIVSGIICLVGAGYAASVLYDIPVRRYLSRKREKPAD